jgi:hypothetical protein
MIVLRKEVGRYGKWIFVVWATCSSLFFAKFENEILKFQKNLDADNDVVYQSMKFELDIPYIRGSTKNDKV